MAQLYSKTGAPVIELGDWIKIKNDPALNELFNTHVQIFMSGKKLGPGENPALDNMYNQFFAETNQELR